jgi:hypothetical protein
MSDLDGVPAPDGVDPGKTGNNDQNRSSIRSWRIVPERRNPGVTLYGPLVILLVAGATLGAYTLHDDLVGEIGYWDAAHAGAVVLAAVFFLRFYFFADMNTWTYGPGRARHTVWWVWLIPVVNLHGPGLLRDILSASAIPTSLEKPNSSAIQLTPFRRWMCLAFLVSWVGLLAAGACLVAAYWIAYARDGEIPFTLFIFDAAFQVFSIMGAACLIVLVMMIIRLQRKRNKEAYFLPPLGRWLPRDQQTSDGWTPVGNYDVARRGILRWYWWFMIPLWLLAVGVQDPLGAVAIPLAPVLYIINVTPLPLPPLPLSRQDMVGTWHGAGNATLTLRANGTFVARDLPEDLKYAADDFYPWSGSGRWAMSDVCGVPQPGICLAGTSAWRAATLEATGSAFSPLLRFPDLGDDAADDLHK